MTPPAVSLIVTTYQMPAHLDRVLSAVERQTVADRLEVIVSDDGSTDETPEVVRRFAARVRFPVKFVSLPHQGFQLARARNEGVRHATAPHVVFLDGDCLIEPDHVEQHLKSWRPNRVTNTYCVRLDQPTSERITCDSVRSGEFIQLAPRSELRKLWIIQLKAWWYRVIGHAKRPALKGGNMGIKRADYARVNGYDERFQGWGMEDDDLGMRLRTLGFRVDFILHRTRTYHLWHPPAESKPATFKAGANYAYLSRKIRLTKCLSGVQLRSPGDVSVRLVGRAAESIEVERWMQGIGCQLTTKTEEQADAEISLASDVRFTPRTDCRVLFADGDTGQLMSNSQQADVVLSADGFLGGDHQIRLPFHELASFFAALGFADPLAAMSATRRNPGRRNAA